MLHSKKGVPDKRGVFTCKPPPWDGRLYWPYMVLVLCHPEPINRLLFRDTGIFPHVDICNADLLFGFRWMEPIP